jgi:hypothetical protein
MMFGVFLSFSLFMRLFGGCGLVVVVDWVSPVRGGRGGMSFGVFERISELLSCPGSCSGPSM